MLSTRSLTCPQRKLLLIELKSDKNICKSSTEDLPLDREFEEAGASVLLCCILGYKAGNIAQANVVETLLASKANLKATAMDDMNALHFAAQKGHTDTSDILIKHGIISRMTFNFLFQLSA